VSLTTPIRGIFIPRLILDIVYLQYIKKIGRLYLSHCTRMKEDPKRKIEVIWSDWGHSRSFSMSSFDRAHTTSYSSFIETMSSSCTVFEICEIIVRSGKFFLPPRVFAPLMGVTLLQFYEDLWRCLLDTVFSRFDRTLTCDKLTDRQTDRQTQSHSIYRASTASRGKNKEKKLRDF